MSFFRCFGSLPLTCACPFSVLWFRSLVLLCGLLPVLCLSVLWCFVRVWRVPVRSLVPSGSLVPFFGSSLRPLARSLPVRSLPGSLRFVLCVRSLRSLVPLSVLCAFSGVCLSVLWCLRSLVPVLWCRVRVDGGRNGRRGDRVAAVQNGGAQPCSSLRGPIVRRPSRTRAEGYASSPTTTPLRRQAGDAAVIAL